MSGVLSRSRAAREARVLVCSSGGVRNLGDDAILLRTAERVRRADPHALIDVLTDEAGSLPAAPGLQPVGLLSESADLALEQYRLVIIAGGGFACDFWPQHLAPRREIAVRSAAAGVPVLVTGQGIGPLTDPIALCHLDELARAAAFVTVRDDLSKQFLHERGITAATTGDDALGLAGPKAARPERPYMVVHLREAGYNTLDRLALRAWAGVAGAVAASQELELVGLVVNDRPEAPERETLDDAGVENVVDLTDDPRTLVTFVQRAHAVVAHSYHVALFAVAGHTPTVFAASSDYYARKAEGLRALAGIGDRFLVPEPPTAVDLAARLSYVRADVRRNRALQHATKRVDASFSAQWKRLVP